MSLIEAPPPRLARQNGQEDVGEDREAQVDADREPHRRVDVPNLDGRLLGGSRDVHVLLITTPGRRTGIQRATCVRYLDTAEGFVVWGTGSGSPHDPDWFRNLRQAKVGHVQVRTQRLSVLPRELVGAERDAVWNDVVLAQAPEVAKYARRAGRTIPVAVLQPTEGRSA